MSLGGLEFQLNIATIVVSLAAVIYWVKLFKRISISGRHDEGWLWIFASVLMVLLLNLSTMLLVASNGRVTLGASRVFTVDVSTLGFVTTFSRTVMAISMTIGAYLLYNSMKSRGDVKFQFKPVVLVTENHSASEAKYSLEPGCSYLVKEGPPGGDVREYYLHSDRRELSSLDLFSDLVTHGVMGFAATRTYPEKLRKQYGLVKTPMVWLTQEKDYEDRVHPSDLTELSHMIKDFVWKGDDTVVLLQGIEYLILHNSFGDVLKMIQGLDDVVVQNRSRLVVAVDPSAITGQQYHLLGRELREFTP